MPSLVLIGRAVWPAIGNRQTDKHIAFYYVDLEHLRFSLCRLYAKNFQLVEICQNSAKIVLHSFF